MDFRCNIHLTYSIGMIYARNSIPCEKTRGAAVHVGRVIHPYTPHITTTPSLSSSLSPVPATSSPDRQELISQPPLPASVLTSAMMFFSRPVHSPAGEFTSSYSTLLLMPPTSPSPSPMAPTAYSSGGPAATKRLVMNPSLRRGKNSQDTVSQILARETFRRIERDYRAARRSHDNPCPPLMPEPGTVSKMVRAGIFRREDS